MGSEKAIWGDPDQPSSRFQQPKHFTGEASGIVRMEVLHHMAAEGQVNRVVRQIESKIRRDYQFGSGRELDGLTDLGRRFNGDVALDQR